MTAGKSKRNCLFGLIFSDFWQRKNKKAYAKKGAAVPPLGFFCYLVMVLKNALFVGDHSTELPGIGQSLSAALSGEPVTPTL